MSTTNICPLKIGENKMPDQYLSNITYLEPLIKLISHQVFKFNSHRILSSALNANILISIV